MNIILSDNIDFYAELNKDSDDECSELRRSRVWVSCLP